MADTKFSALPRATVINNSDDIVIIQGGALKIAARSLLGTSSGSGGSATGGATNFLASSDFTVNQANAPGWSNYEESLTRTSATRLTKTGSAESVFIQFHKAGELTVGKSYKLSADITRVSGAGSCVVRETQDNVSNPDPNTPNIVTGTPFTSSVTFNPGSGDVGLGFIFQSGPGVWDIANLSCVQL